MRRDINELSQKGLVKKIRGGASLIKDPFRADSEYLTRIRRKRHKKLSIGSKAAEMIRDNMVVAFAPGSSTEALASGIFDVHGVTLVTNSLGVAEPLPKIERSRCAFYATGSCFYLFFSA